MNFRAQGLLATRRVLKAFVCAIAVLFAATSLPGCGGAKEPAESTPAAPAPTNAGTSPAQSGPVQVKAELPTGEGKVRTSLVANLDLNGISSKGKAFDDPVMERFAAVGQSKTSDSIPPARRWEFFLPAGITVADYAEQMDAMGMELAVLMDNGQVEYVTKLLQAVPSRRQGALSAETRPYWTWQRGDLLAADREILARSGLEVGDRIILHFWPAATEANLVKLETQFQNRQPAAIYRTRFAVRQAATGYEFYVVQQTAR